VKFDILVDACVLCMYKEHIHAAVLRHESVLRVSEWMTEWGNETWDEKIFHLGSLSHSLCYSMPYISCQAQCDPFSFKSFKDISTKSLDDDFYAPFSRLAFRLSQCLSVLLIKMPKWKWIEEIDSERRKEKSNFVIFHSSMSSMRRNSSIKRDASTVFCVHWN
jgi:hypothetical protein